MAANGTDLRIRFADASEDEFDVRFPYANASADPDDVKALADGIVTNGTIFEQVPVTAISADLITTVVVPVDISD